MRTVFRIGCVLLASGVATAALHEYASPDHRLLAVVNDVQRSSHATSESIVEIRNSRGTTISKTDYSSDDGQHGYGVVQSQWTPDSNFFIYNMTSSGGHQAWHCPTYVFSSRDSRTYSLDEYLGPITDPEFTVTPPDRVRLKGQRRSDLRDAVFHVRLSVLLGIHKGGMKPNPRVQAPHSRVTTRAYYGTGRATRRAPDAQR